MASKQKRIRTSRRRTGVAASNADSIKELLFEPEVMARCRMSRAQIHKLEQANRFPRRKKYGFRRVAWPAREIDTWIALGADGWASDHPNPQPPNI